VIDKLSGAAALPIIRNTSQQYDIVTLEAWYKETKLKKNADTIYKVYSAGEWVEATVIAETPIKESMVGLYVKSRTESLQVIPVCVPCSINKKIKAIDGITFTAANANTSVYSGTPSFPFDMSWYEKNKNLSTICVVDIADTGNIMTSIGKLYTVKFLDENRENKVFTLACGLVLPGV
jgi:hypothetical protein